MRRWQSLLHRNRPTASPPAAAPRVGIQETVCVAKPQRGRCLNEGGHKHAG
jgi:hypothetical protein